jgi:hypothetical protein
VLSVPSERHLHAALADAGMTGIRCAVFYEPDDSMGYTAACTEPIRGHLRRILRRLPLWRAPTAHAWARGPPPSISLLVFCGSEWFTFLLSYAILIQMIHTTYAVCANIRRQGGTTSLIERFFVPGTKKFDTKKNYLCFASDRVTRVVTKSDLV